MFKSRFTEHQSITVLKSIQSRQRYMTRNEKILYTRLKLEGNVRGMESSSIEINRNIVD